MDASCVLRPEISARNYFNKNFNRPCSNEPNLGPSFVIKSTSLELFEAIGATKSLSENFSLFTKIKMASLFMHEYENF